MPDGDEYPAWTTNVIQRNAPGAISAIAFTVTPVKLSVACILGASGVAAIFPPCGFVRTTRRPLALNWSLRRMRSKTFRGSLAGGLQSECHQRDVLRLFILQW